MLEILISSSVLILVLAILRLVLRDRISARLQYALWLLVLVRLLVPVSFFHSPVSVTEAVWPVTDSVRGYSLQTGALSTDVLSDSVTQNLHRLGVHPEWDAYVSDGAGGSRIQNFYSVRQVGHLVWYAGSAVMAVWFLVVNLRLARRLKKDRTPYDSDSVLSVYVAEGIPSPCLFGLFKPSIYLTPRAAEDDAQARQIIAHELTHYRHGDMLWALLRCVCLVVWWFNPLVWLAAALSRQDCELACDEGTIKALGEDVRFDYGRTLVGMARVGARPSDLLCGATTMTTGKKSLKERVSRIASAPKTSVLAVILALCVAAVAVGCTFSGKADTSAAEPEIAVTPSPVRASASDADSGESIGTNDREYVQSDSFAPESGDAAAAGVPTPLPPEFPEGRMNDYILEGEEKERALAMLMGFASPTEVSVNSAFGDVTPSENAAADFVSFVNAHEWTIRYSPGPAANAPDASIILKNGDGMRLCIVSDLDYLELVLPDETFENNHPELHFYDGAADGDYLRELWNWADALAKAQ